jgi:hypothetical protein
LASQASVTIAADAAGNGKEESVKITSKGRRYRKQILFRECRYNNKTAPPMVAWL